MEELDTSAARQRNRRKKSKVLVRAETGGQHHPCSAVHQDNHAGTEHNAACFLTDTADGKRPHGPLTSGNQAAHEADGMPPPLGITQHQVSGIGDGENKGAHQLTR